MDAKCYGVWRIGAMLVCFALSTPAFAGRALPHPFDPEKVPMDGGWEESRVSEDNSASCGKNLLYEGWGAFFDDDGQIVTHSRISVRDVETNAVRETPIPDDEHFDFRGCTPDSRYLFIRHREEGSLLEVFDTRTMRKVHSWQWGKWPGYIPEILSPDGHYLAWYTDEEIMLGGDWKLKTIPLLRDIAFNNGYLVWSPDSRKVYIYSKMFANPAAKRHGLFIYDVQTKKLETFWLKFDLPKFSATEMMVHPETGRIYIQGGIPEGYDIYSCKYLFSLDPAAIPKGGKDIKIIAKRVGDVFAGFSFGPDNTIIFTMVTLNMMDGDLFPEEYNGIFLATLDGKILRRVTKGTYDFAPYYWKEQDAILFNRIAGPNGIAKDKVISMKRKTKTPAQ